MKYLNKGIRLLTNISKWGAMITIFMMMLIITWAVLARSVFNSPLIGDYELVKIMMVALIGFGLSYAESIDGHIKVGLVVDKLNPKLQTIIDIFVYLIVMVIVVYISIIQFEAAWNGMTDMIVNTPLLSIPHYPLQFILAVGFLLWGLEALLKVVGKTINLFKSDMESEV